MDKSPAWVIYMVKQAMSLDLDLIKKIGLDKNLKAPGVNEKKEQEEPTEATNQDLAKFGFKVVPPPGKRLWDHSLGR